ncbi:GLPGLI family protein [Chryseobacterium arthrosphaerae]|uniref:GLPGLI family protein n=1 Tax=Chryseobacterium arthrosphaerae TaxID=651561 RepID=A0A432DTP5_9FLAO|nr:GLPGLI family protein [Chryseobacterium arthrosphaerae]
MNTIFRKTENRSGKFFRKKKNREFNTQKAVCDFAGRKWTAWFTADLPIQDGPYKFYGLPD